jgi:hypothetical protein
MLPLMITILTTIQSLPLPGEWQTFQHEITVDDRKPSLHTKVQHMNTLDFLMLKINKTNK